MWGGSVPRVAGTRSPGLPVRGLTCGRAGTVSVHGAQPVYGGSQRLRKDVRSSAQVLSLRRGLAEQGTSVTPKQRPQQTRGPSVEKRRVQGSKTKGKPEKDS